MTAVADAGRGQYRQKLTADPKTLAGVRRIISAHLRLWGYGPLVDAAVFCANELLTNVPQHTDSAQCVFTLTRQPAGVRVVVSDTSTELPKVREPNHVSESGRGMASVQAMADAWGAEPNDMGKDVWFEIRSEAAAGEAAA